MNILLVSVVERTREIGIRSGGDRVVQPMAANCPVACYLLSLALGFSLIVGLIFGIYPAARLDPVEALRYE